MNKVNQCPMCKEGVLTPTTRTTIFEPGVVVKGLEVSICSLCNSELVFPEQSKRNRVMIELNEVLDLLNRVFILYEAGPQCYEDPDNSIGFLGHAVRLDDETFHRIADILNEHRPRT